MLGVRIQAPFATFRRSTSNFTARTYRHPSPMTMLGVLMSALGIGEDGSTTDERKAFVGTDMGITMLGPPPRIETFLVRQFFHVFDMWKADGSINRPSEVTIRKRKNTRYFSRSDSFSPTRIEHLVDPDIIVWLDEHGELAEMLAEAFETNFANVDRFGALSLGNSNCIVDRLDLVREVPCQRDGRPIEGIVLRPGDDGRHTLPVWIPRRKNSRVYESSDQISYQRFSEERIESGFVPGEEHLFSIGPN